MQGVFDLAALIRMHNRPLSAAIGQVKEMNRKSAFVPLDQREDARQKLIEAIADKKIIQADFENNLQIIYAATLLSGNPSGILRFVSNYPVFQKDGDEVAAESALQDIKLAMSYGKGALDYLLSRNRPIYEPSIFLSLVEPAFLSLADIY